MTSAKSALRGVLDLMRFLVSRRCRVLSLMLALLLPVVARGASKPSVDLTPKNIRFGSQVVGTSRFPGTIDLADRGNARPKMSGDNGGVFVLHRHEVEIGNSSLKVLTRN